MAASVKSTDPKAEKPLNECQAAIAKATTAYVVATTAAQAKCWAAMNAGKAAGTCPAADGKAVAAIAKAETKKVATICQGLRRSPRRRRRSPISSRASSAPPHALSVDCVAAFAATCAADAAVPGLAAYPAACRP